MTEQEKLHKIAADNFLLMSLKNIAEEEAMKYQYAQLRAQSGGSPELQAAMKKIVEIRRRMALSAKKYYEKVK